MDKETREFLEKKFNEIDEKFEDVKRHTDQKFEENQRYTDQKFEDVKQYTDQKFEENQRYTDQKFEDVKQYTDQKFEENQHYTDQKFEDVKRHSDQKFEENKQYFGVVAEGLRNEIRQVAEGHEVIRDEIQVFRREVTEEFKEVRALIKFSYAELDQRIRVLEGRFQTLNDRLDHLETPQR